MSDADRQFSPAAERNRDPILAVLRRVLPASGRVLEVAAGTGQHAAWFAAHLPGLTWCPTEPDAAGRASVAAWCEGLANVEAPVALDVTGPWAVGPVDAIYCANMVHISPWAATLGLVAGAAACLPAGAPLVLYGPFVRDGVETADSNLAFDASLRARDPAWGLRRLEAVVAAAVGFGLAEVVELPANNVIVVLRRQV